MKTWKHDPKDTKRVRLLKNIAALAHDELIAYAQQPIDKNPNRERQLPIAIKKLDARIKKAEGEKLKALQVGIDFSKKQRKKKIRTGKLYVKVT